MLKVLRFLSNDDAASCIRLSLALVIPRKVIGSQNLTARTVVRVQSFAVRTDLEFQTLKAGLTPMMLWAMRLQIHRMFPPPLNAS